MPSRRPPSSPRHLTGCEGEHCDQQVWFKKVRLPGDKLTRLPLEPRPSPDGTIAARPYSDLPGRFLAKGELLEDGEQRWTSHFDTCPDAGSFKKTRTPRHTTPALF